MDKLNKKPEAADFDEELEDLNNEEAIEGDVDKHGRKRRRIKIRRRIRIKKRTSPKKKAKKTMESVAWVLIVAAFIITLVILLLQLDLTDKRTKNWQGKPVSMMYDFRFTRYNLVSPTIKIMDNKS